MGKIFTQLLRDERGGEVIEYALILGLIIVVVIAIITQFGTKVVARWTSVNSSM
jgi:Flp pilus assembly pilin Flp